MSEIQDTINKKDQKAKPTDKEDGCVIDFSFL